MTDQPETEAGAPADYAEWLRRREFKIDPGQLAAARKALDDAGRATERQRVEALRSALEAIADGRLIVARAGWDGWSAVRQLQDYAQDALLASHTPEPRPAPLDAARDAVIAAALEWGSRPGRRQRRPACCPIAPCRTEPRRPHRHRAGDRGVIRLAFATVALLVAVAIWSGAGQRRRFRDWVRAWDEVEEALR